MPTAPAKPFYSLPEVAAALGITRQAVCQRIWRGSLEATKCGRDWIFTPAQYRRILRTEEREKKKKAGRAKAS